MLMKNNDLETQTLVGDDTRSLARNNGSPDDGGAENGPGFKLFGVGGKVLALAILPILLMAGLSVFNNQQTLSFFTTSLDQRVQSDTEREAINKVNDNIKNEMVGLISVVNLMVQAHQNSILNEDSDIIEDTLDARDSVAKAIPKFQNKVGELSVHFLMSSWRTPPIS